MRNQAPKILKYFSVLAAFAGISLLISCGGGSDGNADGVSLRSSAGYLQENLAASDAGFNAKFTFPDMINAWGIAIRPAGAGGHFWVTASNTSYEFVGDVRQSSDPKLQTLYQDKLAEVAVPNAGGGTATGIVFNEGSQFVVTQAVEGAAPITAPAKFIAATDDGIVSAWTERAKGDGTFDRSSKFDVVYDGSGSGSAFFGVAASDSFDRLYLADFGADPKIVVLDGSFSPLPIVFDTPFDENSNGIVDPGEFTPWNVQTLTYPGGGKSLFVAYLQTQKCNRAAQEAGTCQSGALLPGEEDSLEGEEEGGHPNKGRVAEFTFDGKLIAVWDDQKKLNAPWGLVFAPENFGNLSGKLLVGNFGGKGKIAAFDPGTRQFEGYMKDAGQQDIGIPGVWGLIFGNGASLGDSNALYFAAGPNDEVQGLFGSLRPN